MKEYCVDLKIAKELKENGYNQISEFYHRIQKDNIGEFTDFSNANEKSDHMIFIDAYSAPTSDEILKELPSNFIYDGNHYWLTIIKDNENNYQAYYEKTIEDGFKSKMLFRIINKKSSNCLSLTWLYLKKEGYIK